MQEKYEITMDEMKKAMNDGYSVMVIINGEWYELKEGKANGKENK